MEMSRLVCILSSYPSWCFFPLLNQRLSCGSIAVPALTLLLFLPTQAKEGQHRLRAHVRGGAHHHQELPPHQRADVGAGGQVHGRRQTRAAQPLQQVRHRGLCVVRTT